LEKIFDVGILTPLEETDNYFKLKVDHLNLSKYTSMIMKSELRDDLEKTKEIYNPVKEHIEVSLPKINLGTFENQIEHTVSDIFQIPFKYMIPIIISNEKRIKESKKNEIIEYRLFSDIGSLFNYYID
jgi:hypothetical protein